MWYTESDWSVNYLTVSTDGELVALGFKNGYIEVSKCNKFALKLKFT